MKTFYALIARGRTRPFGESGRSFQGINEFLQTDAENKVEAFLKIYYELSKETSDITAVKPDGQRFLLGFTSDEWEEISGHPISIKEGTPDEGIQIQGISETPYK